MLLSTSLVALLIAAAPLQDPAGDEKATAVAPVLGDEVAAVAYVDLSKLDVAAFARRALGKAADDEDARAVIQAVGGWVDALKKGGAKDLYVLLDPADIPGPPVVAVPLAGGADGKAVAQILSTGGPGSPLRWPAAETIRGVVVGGVPDALARIRNASPAARPELAPALAAGGDAPIRVVLIPSTTQRRAIEESMTTLPPPLGGAPVTAVTKGLRWASLALAAEPRPTLRAVLQAKDDDAAKAVQTIVQNALGLLAQQSQKGHVLAPLAPAIGQLKPEAKGDRVSLEADLETAAELVAVPIRQAREAARRSQCVNNLKQIALAMHNYHSNKNTFPPAYSATKDGKPLLSWRVHILPYLEQKALYDEFHLDEPWDSPHNRMLISRMPAVYSCPSGSRTLAREGKTAYVTPRGPSTMFPGAEPVKIQDVTDGTSNTIMVIDGSDALAVVWTKPEDWEVATGFPPLFGHHPQGTNFAFGDGSVKFLKETIKPKTLEALLSRNRGETVSSDDY